MDEEELEYALLQKGEVFVYKIPPRPSVGHRAEDWKNPIWQGKLQIVAKGDRCTVKLVDRSSGQLFAMCPVPENYEEAIERTVDSSRYFALRIDDGKGRHAYIGMGFEDRNDAFDFNATLNDFARRREVEREEASRPALADLPQRDFRLQEGQKIKVEIKGVRGKSRRKDHHEGSQGGAGIAAPLMPPPPAGHTGPATRSRRHNSPSSPQLDAQHPPQPPPQQQQQQQQQQQYQQQQQFQPQQYQQQQQPVPTATYQGHMPKQHPLQTPYQQNVSVPGGGMPSYPQPQPQPHQPPPQQQPQKQAPPPQSATVDLLDLEFSDFQTASVATPAQPQPTQQAQAQPPAPAVGQPYGGYAQQQAPAAAPVAPQPAYGSGVVGGYGGGGGQPMVPQQQGIQYGNNTHAPAPAPAHGQMAGNVMPPPPPMSQPQQGNYQQQQQGPPMGGMQGMVQQYGQQPPPAASGAIAQQSQPPKHQSNFDEFDLLG
ncbi:unnamed protein product [Vitrella brassicaformis CCMP3155]|uniref:NECAP PHear domain-containing protein n=2 Tax=Vitrella brassicaformis TaxID=1169539 RepID=A0A0G4E8G3_VITBC|nr:unnamed protein product [Vitrella brassicaformis CCMP3155]|mmetsp:Transcript_6180/g.14894  ORF Transcript_6180/g.14894 Transcript_6180/m.14894 type:complete len:483 (+) Transcript_6180:33-1481(+)|eukprot:CEL91766.1 unnamed protein product [Vitrella brassicaformis CCMP3155]